MTAFSRTGSGDFPLHLKAMISGPPKSGKTTLLGTVPNIVIADTEPHANNLQSVAHLNLPYKTINSSTDLKDLHMILNNDSLRAQAAAAMNMPDIEAVAIDTLDTFQGLLKKERLQANRATTFLRDDWGWLKTEMESIIQAFLSLPMHVFLVVHTKTKDVGTEKNPRTVILPGLEGAIAESIAGMVGYSLLSFRKQELNPDGSAYTKYWLRAEGDETYEYLGNRAAGRLPDVIEPDFKSLLDAAKAGIEQAKGQQTQNIEVKVDPQTAIQTTGQTPPVQQAPAQQQNPAPSSGQPAAAPKPADDEPITAAALQHVAKLFQTLELPFPQAKIEAMTVGQARELVQSYRAIVSDHQAGNSTAESPQAEMREHLKNMGLVDSAEAVQQQPKAQVEGKLGGTIEEVLAYVGDDLAKVQEAYDHEVAGAQRKTLLDKLLNKGAKEVQTPAETPAQQQGTPAEGVTPAATVADDQVAEDQAIKTIEASLGPVEVVGTEINENATCDVCGNKIDDADLALLGKNRFNKILCVADYLTEVKK